MQLRPGLKLHSTVCEAQVVVVKAPADDVDVRCGGAPMTEEADAGVTGPPDPAFAEGTQIGKRYADDDLGLELLCSKNGTGTLTIGDQPLPLKGAKPLPSSD